MTGTPNRTLAEFFRGSIDLETDTIKLAVFDNSTPYTFDPDTHNFVSDILDGGTTAQELQGSQGYTGTPYRAILSGVSVTADNTNDKGVLDADDVTFQGVVSSADIQGWIIYKQVGGDDTTPGDDPVIIVVDNDMTDAPANLPLTTDGNNVIIQWDSVGVSTIEVL